MTNSIDVPNYKTLSQELEGIIEGLQSDNLDIDDALAGYERGVKVIAQLEEYLNIAENKVRILGGKPAKKKS